MVHLIVDLSYAIFYKYYAIKSYIKISKREDVTFSLDDVKFKDLYKKTFCDMIVKLIKKFKATNVVFCVDCKREMIWRREFYSEYKNRSQLKDFDGRIFEYTFDNVIPHLEELLTELKINRKPYQVKLCIMKHNRCEADDIAYIYSRVLFNDVSKVIITADHDYMQLLDEKTEIYDMKLKDLKRKSRGSNEIDLMFKIQCGDTSDNIPRLNTETCVENLIKNKTETEIHDLFCDNQSEAYKLNKLLVDFRLIPSNIIEEVCSEYLES